MEMDSAPVAHEPGSSAIFVNVSMTTGTHPQLVDLTNPGEVAAEGSGGLITLYRVVLLYMLLQCHAWAGVLAFT